MPLPIRAGFEFQNVSFAYQGSDRNVLNEVSFQNKDASRTRRNQMLGRRFDEGVDFSTGQWQKIALGRAYMRDAHILGLDEPTASLDARAEFEVFTNASPN